MRNINDIKDSWITSIWIKYIDDYIDSNSVWVLLDEDWVKIFEHKLQMWYIIIEFDWLKEDNFADFLNNLSEKSEKLSYIWNLTKNWKLFVVFRNDSVWESLILFNWKLLRLI